MSRIWNRWQRIVAVHFKNVLPGQGATINGVFQISETPVSVKSASNTIRCLMPKLPHHLRTEQFFGDKPQSNILSGTLDQILNGYSRIKKIGDGSVPQLLQSQVNGNASRLDLLDR